MFLEHVVIKIVREVEQETFRGIFQPKLHCAPGILPFYFSINAVKDKRNSAVGPRQILKFSSVFPEVLCNLVGS